MGIAVVRAFKGSDHRIGPTTTEVLTCASANNNVLIPIYGIAEVRGPKSLHASVSGSTIYLTLVSGCSTGDRLQMVKIKKVFHRKKKK